MKSRRVVPLVLIVSTLVGHTLAESWVRRIQAPQYIAVSVADVDRAVVWYRDAFALETLDDTRAPDGRWRIVNLTNAALFVEIIRDSRDVESERSRGFAKVGFSVPDVDAVADRVAGTTGERPRVMDFEKHGIRILQLRDPDGNVIQLSSPQEATTRGDESGHP